MQKPELSPWQNPEDGFPSGQYFDAVIVALEEAGVGVNDSWRNEDWEFTFDLDRMAFDADDFAAGTVDLLVGWSASEESDPLHERDDVELHGFAAPVQVAAGWYWMPCKEDGEGITVTSLGVDVLADPEVVAAAVKALVAPEPTPTAERDA